MEGTHRIFDLRELVAGDLPAHFPQQLRHGGTIGHVAVDLCGDVDVLNAGDIHSG